MSVSAVSATPTPPVSLSTAATPAAVLANEATFQSQLQTYADSEQSALGLSPTTSNYTDITFPVHLVDTYLTVSLAPTPNPFGTTLSGLALATSASSLFAQTPNAFAQHGLGIYVSDLR